MAPWVYGLALGYEDLNDHEELRRDSLLAVLAEKPDPRGGKRAREPHQGQALAGKRTLNRLELRVPFPTRVNLPGSYLGQRSRRGGNLGNSACGSR